MIVLLTNDYLGIDLQGSEDQLVDVVIALLTAVGIYEFENEIKEVS